jgi:hypothetical protein
MGDKRFAMGDLRLAMGGWGCSGDGFAEGFFFGEEAFIFKTVFFRGV